MAAPKIVQAPIPPYGPGPGPGGIGVLPPPTGVGPVGVEQVTPEEKEKRTTEERREEQKKTRSELGDGELIEAILKFWGSQGIDTDNETVIGWAQQVVQMYRDGGTAGIAFATSFLLSQYGPQATPYGKALEDYGLDTYQFPDQLGTTTPSEVAGIRRKIPPEFGPQGYHVDEDTGGILYRNGVLADPATGALIYPPNKAEVEGSPAWMDEMRKSGEEEILRFKQVLVDKGYLDKSALKGKLAGTWTDGTEVAAGLYFTSKYMHYGTALTLDQAIGGPGASFQSLKAIRATIEERVRSTFYSVFGDFPSDTELKSFTDMVIREGNVLQRRKDLAPETAASEAENRALQKMRATPEAQYIEEREENTSLRDAIDRAVQATASLI